MALKVAIACDHGAYDEKQEMMEYLAALGYEVLDFGGSRESMDYPDTALPACEAVVRGEAARAILMCGTGIGMSIIANKVRGIRCAHCTESVSAALTREHNDSNALAMGARVTGMLVMKEIAKVWLQTPFSGDERHVRRIEKITAYEG